MISSTGIPRATRASAISDRWHRQGTASAHMIAIRSLVAISIRRCRPPSNSGVCIFFTCLQIPLESVPGNLAFKLDTSPEFYLEGIKESVTTRFLSFLYYYLQCGYYCPKCFNRVNLFWIMRLSP